MRILLYTCFVRRSVTTACGYLLDHDYGLLSPTQNLKFLCYFPICSPHGSGLLGAGLLVVGLSPNFSKKFFLNFRNFGDKIFEKIFFLNFGKNFAGKVPAPKSSGPFSTRSPSTLLKAKQKADNFSFFLKRLENPRVHYVRRRRSIHMCI